jgi:hypothetical protein
MLTGVLATKTICRNLNLKVAPKSSATSFPKRPSVLIPVPDHDGGCGLALSTNSFNGFARKGIFSSYSQNKWRSAAGIPCLKKGSF